MRAGTQDSRTYIGSVVVDSHGKIGWEEPGGEHIGSFRIGSDGKWDPGKGFDWAAIPGLPRIPRMIKGSDGNIWWEDYPGTQTWPSTVIDGVLAERSAKYLAAGGDPTNNPYSVHAITDAWEKRNARWRKLSERAQRGGVEGARAQAALNRHW